MRTTISKVNDIKNKEARTYTKEKPDVNLLRGVTTVELFDAKTGDKTYEVETENFVSTLIDDARENWSRASHFSIDSSMLYSTNYSRFLLYADSKYGLNYHKNYNIIFDKTPFAVVPQMWKYMVLTDYNGAEKPEIERHKKGELIGYANSLSTAGSDSATVGFINRKESNVLTSSNSIKFVYDFGTHAANGTINSVYFSSGTSTSDRDRRYMLEYKTGIDAEQYKEERHKKLGYYVLSYINFFLDGSKCFLGQKDKKIYFVAFDIESEEIIEEKELKVPGTVWRDYLSLSMLSTGKDSNGNYIIGESFGYLKFNKDGAYLKRVGNNIYLPAASGSTHTYKNNCFTYVSTKHNKVYFIYLSSNISSSSNYVYAYNATTDSNYSSYTISSRGSLHGLPVVEEVDINTIIIHGGKKNADGTSRDTTYKYTMSGGSISRTTASGLTVEEPVNDITEKVIEGFDHVYDPFHNTFKCVGDVTTRNLLPEPIEKTSDYTMKITYELKFE